LNLRALLPAKFLDSEAFVFIGSPHRLGMIFAWGCPF